MIINSFEIGKLIYDKLASLVSNKVFPLVAENGTSFPYIVYTRDSIAQIICKDGIYEDQVSVTIKIVTATYYSGTALAQNVREKLTLYNYSFDNMNIISSLNSADESYENDAYIQTLNFEIKINN